MKEPMTNDKYTKEIADSKSRFSSWLNYQMTSYKAYEKTQKEENQIENKQI